MTESLTRDPADIERDIRRTQDQMSRTVEKIGDQLSVRNLINAFLDKTESGNVDAAKLIDGARRNPLALALIAGGAIWLVSDSDARPSSLGLGKGKSTSDDPRHRDYVAHMDRVEWRGGEDPADYQRRRDIARANYFMVERRVDEDESGFRQRLDDAAEAFRKQRHAWAEQGRHAATALGNAGESGMRSAREAFTANPMIGGLAASVLGAVAGSLLPLSRTEQEKLAGLGEHARELAGEQQDKVTEAMRDKKDELIDKVEKQAQPAATSAATAPRENFSSANDRFETVHQEAAAHDPTDQAGGSDDASANSQTRRDGVSLG